MRFMLLIIISILTFGCSAPTARMVIPNIEDSSSVIVKDLRPASEKINKTFSLLITNEAYAIYRSGDKPFNPSPIRSFQHRLYEKYSSEGIVPEAKIYHFVVYKNLQAELRSDISRQYHRESSDAKIPFNTQKYGVDGLASVISREEFEHFQKEYQRALYTEFENPNQKSVFKVYLEAEIGGKRTFIKTMTPLVLSENTNSHLMAVETAIAFFLDQY